MERADHRRMRARQYAKNLSLGAAIVFAAAQLHQHLIAMHGRANRLRTDIDVTFDGAALSGVWNDEPISVAMHVQPPCDQVLVRRCVLRQGVAVAAGFQQPPAFH